MTLWLVRHAVTLAAPGTCYGRLDVPVDLAATEAAAQLLADALPRDATAFCSPASRCTRLAQALATRRRDLGPIGRDHRLQEMDFGAWEGEPWSVIGEAAMFAWTDEFASHRPGGGETVQALLDRVAAAMQEARRRDGPTLWITHAGVVRAARLLAAGVTRVESAAQWPRAEVPFGGWETLPLR